MSSRFPLSCQENSYTVVTGLAVSVTYPNRNECQSIVQASPKLGVWNHWIILVGRDFWAVNSALSSYHWAMSLSRTSTHLLNKDGGSTAFLDSLLQRLTTLQWILTSNLKLPLCKLRLCLLVLLLIKGVLLRQICLTACAEERLHFLRWFWRGCLAAFSLTSILDT